MLKTAKCYLKRGEMNIEAVREKVATRPVEILLHSKQGNLLVDTTEMT